MSKAEELIRDCTRGCSNELCAVEDRFGKKVISYYPWLTPDQALRAVEIAREETIKEVCEWMNEKLPIYISYCERGVGEGSAEFIEDLKKHLRESHEI